MAIDISKSPALQLAEDLLQKVRDQSPWIDEFSQKISSARNEYDCENNSYDKRYPSLEKLQERYAHWTNVITEFQKNQERVADLITDIQRDMSKLHWCEIPTEQFSKLKFLQQEGGSSLQAYYENMRDKITTLDAHVSNFSRIVKTAEAEIFMIESHPHPRLLGSITNCMTGQSSTSMLSWATGKASRNFGSGLLQIIGAVQGPARRPSYDAAAENGVEKDLDPGEFSLASMGSVAEDEVTAPAAQPKHLLPPQRKGKRR